MLDDIIENIIEFVIDVITEIFGSSKKRKRK